MYRIAIYTICLNEEKFAQRFMDCIKNEANGIFITDTGSTDDTVKILEANGAIINKIKISPWRFDVPRNISMNFIPKDFDIIVCIDLDEILSPGWADAIRRSWTSDTTRLRYQYIWSVLHDGSPGITYWYDKITTRNGYRWVKPVHETLQFYGESEVETYCEGFTLTHLPDHTKSRGNYLQLLELGCKEDPEDDRSSHYLGREYMFHSMYDKAIIELGRHLNLERSVWCAERCASMRFLARCHSSLGNIYEAERWALRACAESPDDREPWFDLSKIYYSMNNWYGLYYTTKRILSITKRTKTYICETEAWSSHPYDYASIAAYNLGLYKEAEDLCLEAIKLDDSDKRLKSNLEIIRVNI